MPWLKSYFAFSTFAGTDPTFENTNRRARRWLPRILDMRQVVEPDLKRISDRFNNTPRKGLGWKTPVEVFREKMLAS
nr:hypothetical protein [Pseudovibrio axinellae]